MNSEYTPEYFIKKFEAIPEDQWFEGDFTDETGTRHCALGHCGYIMRGDSQLVIETPEGNGLAKLFVTGEISNYSRVAVINDGLDRFYPQPTPKQRILVALCDIAKGTK